MNLYGRKIGIALGGGGSLGAYEMGVWTALKELDVNPAVVTGTSIGALVGAMMATGQYEKGLLLWRDLSADKIMKDGLNLDWKTLRQTFKADRRRLFSLTSNYIRHRGLDISPLIELVKTNLRPEELKASPIRFGVVAVSLPFFKQCNVELSRVTEDEVHDWLLASSAIWPLFPVRAIKKKYYIDGGYRDTLPIKFAFDLGAEVVIAVNLFYGVSWHPILNKRDDVINIEPSWPLGLMFNFDQTVIDRNRELGYNDAMKKFNRLHGFRYTFTSLENSSRYDERIEYLLDTHFKSLKPAIIGLLKRYTRKKPLDGLIFVRGLEILAETLKIDPSPRRSLEGLARECYDRLRPHFDSKSVVGLLKKIRSDKQLSSKDEKTALEAIKYILEHHFHTNEVQTWTSRKAKHALAYLLLVIIHQDIVKPQSLGATPTEATT
ncbi:MAG: patatin-like phospholipase family protein [Bacilli bacterium]|jgi:predicted acylesterase/phospholipase RssA